MKPESFMPPNGKRLGKDGIYIFCCADCTAFDRFDGRCKTHNFITPKSARCGDYVDMREPDKTSPLFENHPDDETRFSAMRGAGFDSLAALCVMRDELVAGLHQMEQEPAPERYASELPEFAAEVDRLAGWLDEKRRWISEKEGQERLRRWQGMLEDIAQLTVQDVFLLFPLLRSKWERVYALKVLGKAGIHRFERSNMIQFIRAMYVIFGRFPALLGQWYEVNRCGDATVAEIISVVPLVVRTPDGVELELDIEQLGECLTA
jgi:hypothetical protein